MLLVIASLAWAADVAAPTGKITAVTVFPDRASITRELPVSLVSGRNEIRFTDLPPGMMDGSLQAEGDGVPGATLIGLDVTTRELATDRRARVSALDASLREVEGQLRAAQDAAAAARAEQAFLESVRVEGSKQVGKELLYADQTPKHVAELAELLRTRLPEIQARIRAADVQAADAAARRDALLREKSTVEGAAQWARHDVAVQIEAPAAGAGTVRLTYVVPGAGWTPFYDAHGHVDADNLDFSLSALVTQTTGEDWTGVALTLSTARPQVGTSPPVLEPFYLDDQYRYAVYEKDAEESVADMKKEDRAPEKGAPPPPPPPPMAVRTAEVAASGAAVSFVVPGGSDVTGEGTRRKLKVTEVHPKAGFRHVAVPRLDPSAYVVAKAAWAEAWPILPGEVATFADDSYLGTQHLDLVGPGQDLELGFGRDDRMKVEAKLLQDLTGRPFFGRVKLARRWEYALSWGGTKPTRLEIRDQLPIPLQARYKVKYRGDKAEPDAERRVTWTADVAPGGKVVVHYGYDLHYPKRHPPAEVP